MESYNTIKRILNNKEDLNDFNLAIISSTMLWIYHNIINDIKYSEDNKFTTIIPKIETIRDKLLSEQFNEFIDTFIEKLYNDSVFLKYRDRFELFAESNMDALQTIIYLQTYQDMLKYIPAMIKNKFDSNNIMYKDSFIYTKFDETSESFIIRQTALQFYANNHKYNIDRNTCCNNRSIQLFENLTMLEIETPESMSKLYLDVFTANSTMMNIISYTTNTISKFVDCGIYLVTSNPLNKISSINLK